MEKKNKKDEVNSNQNNKGENNTREVFNKTNDFVHGLIHEFLLKKKYLKTLDSFQEETSLKIKESVYNSAQISEESLQAEILLLQYFNFGKKNEFFTIWNRLVSNHIKFRNQEILKVEFFLQIYFSVYPLLPHILGEAKNLKDTHIKELKKRMKDFKTYLDSKEIELSKSTDFLAYYALPYIEQPRNHPSFKHIFTNEWTNELRTKLKEIVNVHLNNSKQPLIFELFNTYQNLKESNSELRIKMENSKFDSLIHDEQSGIEEKFNRLNEEYSKLKKKEKTAKSTLIECQKKWTNFSIDIIKTALNMIHEINKAHSNNLTLPVEVIEKVDKKFKKYENFLKSNSEELEKNNSILKSKENSVIEEEKSNLNMSKSNEKLNDKSLSGSQVELNNLLSFNFIISLFKSKQNSAKINYILRELRSRLTKKRYFKIKTITLFSIIYYDLFCIKSEKNNFFTELLCEPEISLELLKLLNSVANEKTGRSYLLMKLSLVEDIVQQMMKEDGDTEKRQICLGIIQKFTLRSDPQRILIELDIIMWITSILISELNYISDYTLEYGLALLMNLSLRSSGRDKCELVSKQILKILCNYLDHESLQVRTIINGTLYSLLKRKKFREEAKAIGLESVLNYNLRISNDQMKKQIQYILEEIKSVKYEEETDEKYDEEMDEDPQNIDEEDIVEDDLFEEDSIDNEEIEIHNNMIREFIISNQNDNQKEIGKINDYIRNKVNQIDNTRNRSTSIINKDELDRPLMRPTTPMNNLNNTSNSQIFNGPKKKSFLKEEEVEENTEKILDKVPEKIKFVPNNNDYNKIPEVKKYTESQLAFLPRDKIVRTPPK